MSATLDAKSADASGERTKLLTPLIVGNDSDNSLPLRSLKLELKSRSETFAFVASAEHAVDLDRRRLTTFKIGTSLGSIIHKINRQAIKANVHKLEFRSCKHLFDAYQEGHIRHELAPA